MMDKLKKKLLEEAAAKGVFAEGYVAQVDPLDDIAKAAINNHIANKAFVGRGRRSFSTSEESTRLCHVFIQAFAGAFEPVFDTIKKQHPEVEHVFLCVHYSAVHVTYSMPRIIDDFLYGALVYEPTASSRENVDNIMSMLDEHADEGELISKLNEHGLIAREDYVPMMNRIKYG